MKTFFALLYALLMAVSLGQSVWAKDKISISCGSNGLELDLCKKASLDWSKKSGVDVDVLTTPNDSNERLALYQQLLSARSSDIDVYQIDVVWPGILADHLEDLSKKVSPAEESIFLKAAFENNRVNGRLVALPWYVDAGLLYYRKDLLEKYGRKAPETWEDLEDTARFIQSKETKNGVYGFVFQGRAYEGLTCNALEWMYSFGGRGVDQGGTPKVDAPGAVHAFKTVAGWVGTIAPIGVLSYSEEESRGVFQSGKAVFMRNWPYAWALLNSSGSSVRGKVGIVALPASKLTGFRAATLGGWSLAVSKYSKHKEAASDLVKYLTRQEEQRRRLEVGGFNPSIANLYVHPDLNAQYPYLLVLKKSFERAVARPGKALGSRYGKWSSTFWTSVHEILQAQKKPETELKILQEKLTKISSAPGSYL